MNKNFCIRCLIKLSMGLAAYASHQGQAWAESSQDSENQFLFSLDDENGSSTDSGSWTRTNNSDLLYYPGAIQNNFYGVDEDTSLESAKGSVSTMRQSGLYVPTQRRDQIADASSPASAAPTQQISPAEPLPAQLQGNSQPQQIFQQQPPQQQATQLQPNLQQIQQQNAPSQPFAPPSIAPIELDQQPALEPLQPGSSRIIPNIDQSLIQGPVQPTQAAAPVEEPQKTILINFNNVGIIEYIRFISRISNHNFVFDENDLQFNVTIVSEEPTTIENIMAALIQELRIHGLTLIDQGNTFIIHKNPKVNSLSRVVDDEMGPQRTPKAEIEKWKRVLESIQVTDRD